MANNRFVLIHVVSGRCKTTNTPFRPNEATARTGPAVLAMLASMFACLLGRHHRRRCAPPPRRGARRNMPPIHPQSVGRMPAARAPCIALALELRDEAAEHEWNHVADLFNQRTTARDSAVLNANSAA